MANPDAETRHEPVTMLYPNHFEAADLRTEHPSFDWLKRAGPTLGDPDVLGGEKMQPELGAKASTTTQLTFRPDIRDIPRYREQDASHQVLKSGTTVAL
jgi:hypothetical protein